MILGVVLGDTIERYMFISVERYGLSWMLRPLVMILFAIAIVGLLLLTGIAVIFQNEAAYRDLQQQEARVQAEILAASVTAALDFNDAPAAQEAVEAIRVNRQARTIGIYDSAGRLVAADPPLGEPDALGRPCFALADTAALTDFIVARVKAAG